MLSSGRRWVLLLSQRVAVVGVITMLLIAILTVADILLRWLFSASVPGFNEILEIGIAVAVASTFPAGAANRVNLTIDLLAPYYGPKTTVWLKAIGALALLIFYIFLSWRIGDDAASLAERNAVTIMLEMPLAPFIWVISGLLAACGIVQFIIYFESVRNAVLGIDDANPIAVEPSLNIQSVNQKILLAGIGLLIVGVVILLAIGQNIEFLSSLVQSTPGVVALIMFALMWILALIFIPLGATMGLLGVLGAALLAGLDPALSVLGSSAVEFLTNRQLAVLPLFLIMGSFAAAAGLSSDIYDLAQATLGHRRGGLALATIGGCAGFGALTGSSLATAATIGNVALPEMRARGYSPGLATGCVAAGGTLGQLVPPSTVIVLYAILTEESIGQLFIAAIIPAAIAVILYLITISIYVRISPDAAPPAKERLPIGEILRMVAKSWGVLFLFGLVIGGLYGGIFTATEAAAVGAGSAFLFALFRGKLSDGAFWRVIGETTATTAMIYMLIFGAVTFSFFMGITGLPELMTSFIGGLDMSPLAIIAILLVIYILLGAIMDPFPIMVITVPIIAPIILDLGFDLLWWGIIMVVVVETGLITPPFGINVFILKGISGGDVPTSTVFKGVMPFVAADLIKLAFLVLFPSLVTWLPSTMISSG
jgi:tripartite ATP-independent transporter DctM subunit